MIPFCSVSSWWVSCLSDHPILAPLLSQVIPRSKRLMRFIPIWHGFEGQSPHARLLDRVAKTKNLSHQQASLFHPTQYLGFFFLGSAFQSNILWFHQKNRNLPNLRTLWFPRLPSLNCQRTRLPRRLGDRVLACLPTALIAFLRFYRLLFAMYIAN